MKYAHLLSRFSGSFWLIKEETLLAVAHLLEARINNTAALPMLPDETEEEPSTENESMAQGGVALIDVQGILGKRLSLIESACGGCDYDAVAEALEAALATPGIRAAVLRFDSPGGTVVGCQETAARIAAACAGPIPVVAFTDTECMSAAYWLAASCSAIFATPSALVGSTGTKMVIRDQSEKNAKEGVKFHVFKSGSMKDVGASYRAPSEEEAKLLQAHADKVGADFRAAVLAHRPQVAEEAFATAMFYEGAAAVGAGLVDKIVPDLRAVLSELGIA